MIGVKRKVAVKKTATPDRNWAASVIQSPFIFLPNDLAVGSGANPGTLANYGNTGPANFTVVDTHAPIEYDANEGVYTGSPTGSTNYAWAGAAYDDAASDLYQMFDLFSNYSQAAKTGGGILLLGFRLKVMAAQANGPILMVGSANSTSGEGWRIDHSSAASDDLAMQAWKDSITPFISGTEITDAGGGLVPDDGTERHITIMLNALDATVANDAVKLAIDGTIKAVAAASTISAAWKSITPGTDPSGVSNRMAITLFGANNSTASGTRTVGSSLKGRVRDFFAINLTSSGAADVAADFASIASALANAPKYALPRYLDKY